MVHLLRAAAILALIHLVRTVAILASLIQPPADGPPIEPVRSVTVTGKIEVKTRTFDLGFGPVESHAYFLMTGEPASPDGHQRISLVLNAADSDTQKALLQRLATSKKDATISGDWIDVNGDKFLQVKAIKELE